MNDTTKSARPQLKGGIIRDDYGNPPGTIYFFMNPIEWIKSKFFGKKPEIIPEPVQEIIQEKTFEELVAEKLDLIFNCNHDVCFRLKQESYRMYGFAADEPRELFFHGNFRYARYFDSYEVSIYSAEKPELIEMVYRVELVDSHFIVNHRHHNFLRYKYIPGIWDQSFLETLDELVDIKIAERKDAEEKRLKELEQEELNKKIAEEVKQERIRKMFEKNT